MCPRRLEAESESAMSDSGAVKQQGVKGRGTVKQKKTRRKLKCEKRGDTAAKLHCTRIGTICIEQTLAVLLVHYLLFPPLFSPSSALPCEDPC